MPRDERLPESRYPLPPKSGCTVLTPQARQHEAAKIAALWHRNYRRAQSVAELRSKASTRFVYFLHLLLSEIFSWLFAAHSLIVAPTTKPAAEQSNFQKSAWLYLGLVCQKTPRLTLLD